MCVLVFPTEFACWGSLLSWGLFHLHSGYGPASVRAVWQARRSKNSADFLLQLRKLSVKLTTVFGRISLFWNSGLFYSLTE